MSQNFAIRIVNVDFYMSQPVQDLDTMYSDFRGCSISQVPVIRIFGSTETGKKICLHIHGVFPYLYIPYDGCEDPNSLKYQIAANIDKAVNISFGQASSTAQHVFKVQLVSGTPFYGYHAHEHQFLKIFLVNPSLVRKVSNLLQSEIILGRLYQPHESHIPYILQFMIDYNLHGMSKILLKDLKYRDSALRQSTCELEADALSENILNQLEIKETGVGLNPGIAALWKDEKQRLRNKGEESSIGACLTLEISQTEPTKTHQLFKRALTEKLLLNEDLSASSDKSELNASVYPAEVSKNPSNESFSESFRDFNSTFDEDARNLFEVLKELEKRNVEGDDAEEDSVLSQIAKENFGEDEEKDTDLDLNLSLADTTPFKRLVEGLEEEFEAELDRTVPQLDGQDDGRSSTVKKNKYRALPVVLSSQEPPNRSDSDLESVKRKLNFQNSSTNITIYEERTECEYKPANKRKPVDKPALCTETNKLSAAELYDAQTNYKPKEGCSTKLTQNSDLKLSSESDIFSSNPSQSAISFPTKEKNPFCRIVTPVNHAPSKQTVLQLMRKQKIPIIKHQPPFYSNPNDATANIEVGQKVLKIASKNTNHLEDFQTFYNGIDSYRRRIMPLKFTFDNVQKYKLTYCSNDLRIIGPLKKTPTYSDAVNWLKNSKKPRKEQKTKIEKILIPASPNSSDLELSLSLSPNNSCQISGATLDYTYGFKPTPENYQNVKTVKDYQYLTILSMEIHIETRLDLRPDPAYDEIKAVFYAISEDSPDQEKITGIIGNVAHPNATLVQSELELFQELVKLVKKCDPDILIGYEIELLSWGFLLERSKVLNLDLLGELSRTKDKHRSLDQQLRITGRILLDVWRLLRHEVALQSYTFENMVYHLLHKRVPKYSFRQLTDWFKGLQQHRTVCYYWLRVEALLQILEQQDLMGRTSELARLFGIQFYEVLSRGSQFRVESMMLRLAKPLNYIPVSPSVQQRAKMKAPEFLPLILEPESKLYVDPVIVLDFQSLYPSIIIAYNYCFSTCLGKVLHLGKNSAFEFGATQLKVSKKRLQKLLDGDAINFSPCGVAFVKSRVRDGIMPKMLREILETRLMVKNSMKQNRNNQVLQKVLHNRQLGLKLIANVTYGYTAANFSGRMPAVELGDSVVSKGRETLQRAIEMVERTPEWGARVVYGDTDSLFVLVPGATKKQAFDIGKKIADAVTGANPDPVKLKLEKVYHPCILQTKKRYVGYMYENAEQEEPIYEAKGIETVRRDGCPAVAKMLEKCLRLLFETKDVSKVKQYVLRQFDKILSGRVSLQDLTFAKEYRGASGYRPGACVPALELTRKWTAVDRRNEPRRGERVPYVIVSGPPGVPLIRLVRSPHDFLQDPTLRPNSIYYITKVIIPPLNRCFTLIGADLNAWFNKMPRKQFQYLRNASPVKKSTLSQYFASNCCACCRQQTQNKLCDKCLKTPQRSLVVLHEKLQAWERAFCDTNLICQSCGNSCDSNSCISLDCPVLYKVHQASRDLEQAPYVREVIESIERSHKNKNLF